MAQLPKESSPHSTIYVWSCARVGKKKEMILESITNGVRGEKHLQKEKLLRFTQIPPLHGSIYTLR